MNNLQSIFIREQVIRKVRDFFEEKNFHEVITPSISRTIPLEPNLFPFVTQWITGNGKQDFYLSTSPERGLKKMLARGIGNCFAISKSFRNLEGSGSLHIPEFLMLEWYRENADYQVIMKDVRDLLSSIKTRIDDFLKREHSPVVEYQNLKIDLSNPWKIYSLPDLFLQYANLNLEEIIADDNKIVEAAQEKGYNTKNASWNELYDQIFVNEIESKLPKNKPFFLIDFPWRISPLCKPKKDKSYLAERFEFYIAGMEMGNGNTENTDCDSIKKIFADEQDKRIREKLPVPPLDQEFLNALKAMGQKQYAGIGVGIDRLSMLFANLSAIEHLR
jgi:elongation factor P--beta-lysine ligase